MTLYIGSVQVNKAYVGATEAVKAYQGSTLVHDASGVSNPLTFMTTVYNWWDSSDNSKFVFHDPGTDTLVSSWTDSTSNLTVASQSLSAEAPVRQADGSLYFPRAVNRRLLATRNLSAVTSCSIWLKFRNAQVTGAYVPCLHFARANNAAPFAAQMISGNASRPDNTMGTPEYYVNGTLVSPTTAGALFTALANTNWNVLEIRNASLASFNSTISFYNMATTTNRRPEVYLKQLVITNVPSAGEITSMLNWMATK